MKLLEKPIGFEELMACLDTIRVNGLFLFLKTFESSGKFSFFWSLLDLVYPMLLFCFFLFFKSCRKCSE